MPLVDPGPPHAPGCLAAPDVALELGIGRPLKELVADY